jgi:hypothetical protein
MINNTSEVNFTVKLQPEWYKVAQGLSIILGFDCFEDYVADCIETNVRMYVAGGDVIDEKFRAHYKHMIYELNNNKPIGVVID